MSKSAFVPSRSILALFTFLAGFALPVAVAAEARVSEAYGQLPLHFEANRGQTHEDVRFLARGPGYSLYLTAGEAVLVLARSNPDAKRDARRSSERLNTQARATPVVVRMSLVGAAPKPPVSGLEELPGKANYFIGKDPAKWRTNVPTYAKVHYREVYPGIDLLYYGNQRQLEYDFVVAPGADPRTIMLGFDGAHGLDVDARGDLVIHTALGPLHQRKPVIYQEVDGVKKEIPSGYVVTDTHRVSFRIAAYDRSRPLVIDPILFYSTYLGGSSDDGGAGIAVDAAGNAYVTGDTLSTNFPTTTGVVQPTRGGSRDAFVTKLNSTGSALVYSTYLGGSLDDLGFAIAVDALGNAYITGSTRSGNFPTTTGVVQPTLGGTRDAFVTKIDSSGSALVYSTYLGGSGFEGIGFFEEGRGIAADAQGNAYVAGGTLAANFPTTMGAFQPTSGGLFDAFVTKLNSTGSAFLYSTYLGGTGSDFSRGIAVDAPGNAYVTGATSRGNFPITLGAFQMIYGGGSFDAFVTKLNSTGSALVYSTYLGGNNVDQGGGIVVDILDNAYVTGATSSSNFPTTIGAFDTIPGGSFDAFVTKLDPNGSALVYSTYLGGSNFEEGRGIAIDALDNAHVTGQTFSSNFPTTTGAFQTTFGGGSRDAFVTKLDPNGSALVYSTYLGGSGADQGFGIALDTVLVLTPNAYVTGSTGSSNFPTTTGAFQRTFSGGFVDAFVSKIADISPPATLALSPAADTNPVGTSHTVTATVKDAGGNPVPDIVVRFTVTGSVSTSGSCRTDANGQCSFIYQGPPLPGADVITAFADTNDNGSQDLGEPGGAASKSWVLPVTTPLCEILITDGGQITAANGDTATLGGNARSSATGQTSGQQVYQDHGPAQPLTVKSQSVLTIVCEGTTQASIFGQATINGAGSFFYRISVQDLGEPGVGRDTYLILLQNGYTSGQQTLEGGNVQIRRQ